jgi:hypothetical protein
MLYADPEKIVYFILVKKRVSVDQTDTGHGLTGHDREPEIFKTTVLVERVVHFIAVSESGGTDLHQPVT